MSITFPGLLSIKEPQKMEAALNVADNLIRSEPSDLHEVTIILLCQYLYLCCVLCDAQLVSMDIKCINGFEVFVLLGYHEIT